MEKLSLSQQQILALAEFTSTPSTLRSALEAFFAYEADQARKDCANAALPEGSGADWPAFYAARADTFERLWAELERTADTSFAEPTRN